MKIKPLILFAIIILSINSFACFGQRVPEREQVIADKTTYLENISLILKKEWPNNRTINIVCHGHSVPAGYFKTPKVNTFDAYPHVLHKSLKEQFPFAVINVIVTAIGGENSEQGAKRFEQDVLACLPDLILIDYALNDRSIGLVKAKKAWTTMIEKAKLKGIKIILLTPTADKRAKLNDPKDPLNLHAQQIRQLAKKYHLGFVDSYAVFKKYVKNGGKLNDLMSQVNHPNKKGHELVVRELLQWFPE